MLMAGLRRRHTLATAGAGIAEQWREFLAAAPIADRVGSSYYGIMCGSDGATLEYMCGVEVPSFGSLSSDIGRMKIPPQRYAVFSHPDGATLETTWRRILQWLDGGAYESAHRPDFERYSSTPGDGGTIEVWVGVVERRAR